MRAKPLFACASVAAALAFAVWRWSAPPACQVALPIGYRFVDYTPRSSPFFVAAVYRSDPSSAGTSDSWRFEGDGPADDAVPRLLAYLSADGDWSQKRSRTGMWVLARGGGDCLIAVYPVRNGNRRDARHFVRVNGPWRNAGPVERALAGLPSPWLRTFGRF